LRPINDIDIKSVGFWRMGAVVAQNYYQDRCILVGDACHGMPPAGGFGMNTGI
jgi:putative polyketide hydroxylase